MNSSDGKKGALNSKALNFGLILNFEKGATTGSILSYYNNYIDLLLKLPYFVCISPLHDKDLKGENHEAKTIHMHIFISLTQKETLGHVLNEVSTLLHIDKKQLSIEGSNNDFLLVQYLTHKNDKGAKYKYDVDLVRSNDLERFKELYSKEYVRPLTEQERLSIAFAEATSITEYISILGDYSLANKMRPLFKDYLAEKRQFNEYEGQLIALSKRANSLENYVRDLHNRIIALQHNISLGLTTSKIAFEQIVKFIEDNNIL